MASNWGTIIMCPFYLSEGDVSIRCEGISSDAVQQWWAHKDAKIAYREAFCETMDYGECPVAQLLEKKYE